MLINPLSKICCHSNILLFTIFFVTFQPIYYVLAITWNGSSNLLNKFLSVIASALNCFASFYKTARQAFLNDFLIPIRPKTMKNLFGWEREKTYIWEALNLLMCANNRREKRRKIKQINRKKRKKIICHMSRIICHISPNTCHIYNTNTNSHSHRPSPLLTTPLCTCTVSWFSQTLKK